jgi:hypothetical protein
MMLSIRQIAVVWKQSAGQQVVGLGGSRPMGVLKVVGAQPENQTEHFARRNRANVRARQDRLGGQVVVFNDLPIADLGKASRAGLRGLELDAEFLRYMSRVR